MSDIANEFYVDLVLATAIRLIGFKGSTTTLDIKNELRERHTIINTGYLTFKPVFTQNVVSDAMIILEGLNFFTFTDNGTYRTYKLNVPDFVEKEKEDLELSISVSEAFDIINDLEKDNDIVVTFIKKDKSSRTINGYIYSPNRGDGFIRVFDNDLPDDLDGTNIRTVDLRRLISFELDNVLYIIDKTIK